jgi:hypothetical protein
MRWTSDPGRGFTHAGMGERTWLPLGSGTDVAAQRADPRSTLRLTRALIRLHRRLRGGQELLDGADGVLCYRRGDRIIVAVNTTPEPAAVAGRRGRLVMSSDPDRRDRPRGMLRLGPYEAAVIESGA